jgi:hypothetical protein
VLVQLGLGFDDCTHRLGSAAEGYKKGIPLRVHLMPIPVGEGFPQDAVVVSQQDGILILQAMQ